MAHLKTGQVQDGLSQTILVGEALPDARQRFELTEDNLNASPPYATSGQITKKDHWYIAGDVYPFAGTLRAVRLG